MREMGGFKARPTTYKLSAAPTSRARCRVCRKPIPKGDLTLEACVFVMPGRRTVLVQHAMCVMGALAADVVRVYRTVDRLPAAAELVDSERVEAARSLITERAKGAGV